MFMTNYNLMFNFLLFLFSIFTMNFSSLFFTWIFMELNLLMVVPLLLVKSSFMKEQGSLMLKYFLIQVMGSIFILITISLMNLSPLEINYLNISLMMVLMLKSGTPPLHFWFPQVMYFTNPYQAFMLLSIQKIIPLFLISNLMSELMLMFIILSSIMGSISGLNQNSMMKILAYSSLVHSSWMISGMFIKFLSGYFYFFIYSIITYFFIKMLNKLKIKFISEMMFNSKSITISISFILSVFMLSGTPPFIGFFSKIYILISILENKLFLISFFLILGSTISFFFYIRLIILSSLFSQSNNKNKILNKSLNIFYPIFFNLAFFSMMVLME